MAATIRDVARAAGVSPSTVSRVINQKGTISEGTKQKIYAAMESLNFVPNDFARGLATGSTHAIALVIDLGDVGAYSNTFFNNSVFGIETAAHRSDYNLIITNGAPAACGASAVERLVSGKKADGVILPISIVTDALLHRLEELEIPCVILGHLEEFGTEASWIDINNTQAGRKAAKLLLQRGYQRIAFLSDGGDNVFNRERIAGFWRELEANGHPVSEKYIVHSPSTVESGMQCVLTLMREEAPPDAIICSNDRLALGALRAARQLGLSVPESFGIVCFDNTPVAELAETSITSIDVDTFELGLQAAEILINQIENPQASLRQILLSTKIIERMSTQRTKLPEKKEANRD